MRPDWRTLVDNAVVESFFASLKTERTHDRQYATAEHAQADVADYIDQFYNRRRRHSTLGQLSPAIYELRHVAYPCPQERGKVTVQPEGARSLTAA